jgi:hypothetical protein
MLISYCPCTHLYLIRLSAEEQNWKTLSLECSSLHAAISEAVKQKDHKVELGDEDKLEQLDMEVPEIRDSIQLLASKVR